MAFESRAIWVQEYRQLSKLGGEKPTYVLGVICPLLSGIELINLSAKNIWGPVPMSPYASAFLASFFENCGVRQRALESRYLFLCLF